MNRKLHAYDVCLESLDVNGSVSALKLYGPRGLNQAEGGFLTLESIAEDTKAQVRYLRQLGINKKPARLIVIPDNDQGLTSSALEHKTEIKKQISALGITHLEPFMHGDKAQELADQPLVGLR